MHDQPFRCTSSYSSGAPGRFVLIPTAWSATCQVGTNRLTELTLLPCCCWRCPSWPRPTRARLGAGPGNFQDKQTNSEQEKEKEGEEHEEEGGSIGGGLGGEGRRQPRGGGGQDVQRGADRAEFRPSVTSASEDWHTRHTHARAHAAPPWTSS